MTPNPDPPATDPLAVLLLGAWLAVEAATALLVALLALLLTVIQWKPAPTPPLPAAGPLATLRVVELRRLARAAGHRQLARSGRRAELLAALAVA